MLAFRPMEPEYAALITPHPAQREEHAAMTSPAGLAVIRQSMALAAWSGDRCIGAAGVRPIWRGRAEAWIVLGEGAGECLWPIVRKCRVVLDNHPARRIEMTVRMGNAAGLFLAKRLGFTLETPKGMTAYFPDGSTVYLFARVRA